MTPPPSVSLVQAPRDDGLVMLDGHEYLVVRDVDQLPPFLCSVVSHSDHWLFVSSRGGLTAGRRSPASALFPYVTDDKLHTCHAHTGPSTTLRVLTPQGPVVWEPFMRENDDPRIRRALYKTALSERLVFEETHEGLGLTFRAKWETSELFGFVRTVSLHSVAPHQLTVEAADGVLDLMPAGVPQGVQQGASCLVNAYTRADVDAATQLAVVALQALIVDQPLPAESLRATTVVAVGLPHVEVLLSTDQLQRVRRGQPTHAEAALKGRRAAYLITTRLTLEPGATVRWRLLADVDRDHLQVEALRARLSGSPLELEQAIAADIEQGAAHVQRNVASADGLQCTADRRITAHHGANVLFNNMRGGVFDRGHQVGWADFGAFLAQRNKPLAARVRPGLASGSTTVTELLRWAREQGDLDLVRLAHEYLPLFFSRRHGDPSRPWNAFDIHLRHDDGTRSLNYQGNWRDIFQNWEALCASHPDFLEGVITTFLDASTADGFNPYRLTRAGIDWEVPEEGNPWATIGYWGDHQIVYLNRLLEALERLRPGRLEQLLAERWFVFADVPYRLGTAAQLAADPRHTIRFDVEAERRSVARAAQLGDDGRRVADADGRLVHASLLEKLLIPVLAKLANLVVDGGIWMNTQRPEWNDANNALVGNGLSVVTLCQLRRHLGFLARLFTRAGERAAELSVPAAAWLQQTTHILQSRRAMLTSANVSPVERRSLLDELQRAFERYREPIDASAPRGSVTVKASQAAELCQLANTFLDHSIAHNRRADRLWHAYNLLRLGDEGSPTARVEPLYEMLEGQVAVLSSGVLGWDDALALIDAMFASRLYRADQKSFLLYPDRALKRFLEKNEVPDDAVAADPLLSALLAHGDTRLVARDVRGVVRFAGHLQTVADLEQTLARLATDPRWQPLVHERTAAVVALFERVFDFASFTGRSGSMFGYEGLGCIYWHMVSKLLLAVQEVFFGAVQADAPAPVQRALAIAYHRVRDGLGFNKTPAEFGAFPSDPYSHTPRHAGAQQPGMTGSVKEEILARWGELGVEVTEGRLRFCPRLLPASEMLTASTTFTFYAEVGPAQQRTLSAGELGFTYCQVPVVYRVGATPSHQVQWAGGQVTHSPGATLDEAASRAILGRTGEVTEVVVTIDAASLFRPPGASA